MEKFILALSISFALLLAGCTAPSGDVSIPPSNNSISTVYNGFSDLAGEKGTVLVTAMDVVAGCGVQPPDGDTSSCGVHSSAPHAGQVAVTPTSLAGIDFANATSEQLSARALPPALFIADAKGMFSFSLPEGDYLLTFSAGGSGVIHGPIKVQAGQTISLPISFTKQVPGTRPE